MTKTRWVALVVVVAVVSTYLATWCRSSVLESHGIHEFSIRMIPFWWKRSLPKLDDLFGNVKAGQTIILRFKVNKVSSPDRIYPDYIHVEKGKVVFYSEEGEYQFMPGPGETTVVNVKFHKGQREKTFHFIDGRPYFFLVVGCSVGEPIRSHLRFHRVIYEDLSNDFYYLQSVSCRSFMRFWATVELKVQFSDDYSGSFTGWHAYTNWK